VSEKQVGSPLASGRPKGKQLVLSIKEEVELLMKLEKGDAYILSSC
jgi:hypothetical protein